MFSKSGTSFKKETTAIHDIVQYASLLQKVISGNVHIDRLLPNVRIAAKVITCKQNWWAQYYQRFTISYQASTVMANFLF